MNTANSEIKRISSLIVSLTYVAQDSAETGNLNSGTYADVFEVIRDMAEHINDLTDTAEADGGGAA